MDWGLMMRILCKYQWHFYSQYKNNDETVVLRGNSVGSHTGVLFGPD